MSRVMVLAAGHGTRLRPLTDERPKPLVPFGDRSLLEHALERLGPEFLPAVVNTHHLTAIFFELTRSFASKFQVIVEPELRGTAGGVAGARELFNAAPVAVTNADVLARVDFARLLALTPEEGLCLAVVGRPRGEGPVGLGRDGRVVRLRGECFGEETEGADYVCSLGIGARVLEALPERGCLVGDVAMPLARRGAPLVTLRVEGSWLAPGDGIASYLDAHATWLEQRGGPSQASYIAPGARVRARVEVISSVIGEGAEVSGQGCCERVVAWPGARFAAPLADAVVTTSGRIVHRPAGERAPAS
jgi:NDP-sugar pyrophosphorylase family protein